LEKSKSKTKLKKNNIDGFKDAYYIHLKKIVDIFRDDLSKEFTEGTGATSDMTHPKWKTVLDLI